MIEPMKLGGAKVDEQDVLGLAQALRRADEYPTADLLEDALIAGVARVDLDHPQREAVLRVLEGASEKFAPLQAALLKEHAAGRDVDGVPGSESPPSASFPRGVGQSPLPT
jgi:hypothetical protein